MDPAVAHGFNVDRQQKRRFSVPFAAGIFQKPGVQVFGFNRLVVVGCVAHVAHDKRLQLCRGFQLFHVAFSMWTVFVWAGVFAGTFFLCHFVPRVRSW